MNDLYLCMWARPVPLEHAAARCSAPKPLRSHLDQTPSNVSRCGRRDYFWFDPLDTCFLSPGHYGQKVSERYVDESHVSEGSILFLGRRDRLLSPRNVFLGVRGIEFSVLSGFCVKV